MNHEILAQVDATKSDGFNQPVIFVALSPLTIALKMGTERGLMLVAKNSKMSG
jgi:hypothetical protein